MAAIFYFKDQDGRKFGPMSAAKLKQAAANGRLTEEMMVRRSDGDWRPATSVAGLFGAAEPAVEAKPQPAAAPVDEYRLAAPEVSPTRPKLPPMPDLADPVEDDDEEDVDFDPGPVVIRKGKRGTFPMLNLLTTLYLVFAVLSAVVGLGIGLFLVTAAMTSGEEVLIGASLLPAGMAIGGGLLHAAVFATASEFLRLLLTLEDNQRVQTDLLDAMRRELLQLRSR